MSNTALSIAEYNGDGTTTQFTIHFEYLDKTHVKCLVDGIEKNFTWLSPGLVQVNPAPTAGSYIQFYRNTSPSVRLVDYATPGTLTEEDLDTDSRQAFYLAQEANDTANRAASIDRSTGMFNAKNRKIVNVGNPTTDTDAATKLYVDEVALGSLPLPLEVHNGGTGVSTVDGLKTLIGYDTLVPKTDIDTLVPKTDIGVSVQAFDANTAKTNVAQNFTLPQRSALLTDNDGSFDLAAKQNFKCTTAAALTLTFTNQVDGLSGSVIFVNTSNHTVSAHANTKLTASDLAKLSVTGTYRIDYLSDGTNAYCSVIGSY